MFCNGECEKKGKKCGLLYDIIMEHAGPTGQNSVETITKCAFHHILDSLIRQEQGQVRIQSSVDSARNQKANDDKRSSHIMGTGFMALTHAVNNNDIEFKKAMKKLGNISKPLELENKK